MQSINHKLWCKAVVSVAICFAGAVSMWASDGETGIGWAVLGIALLW